MIKNKRKSRMLAALLCFIFMFTFIFQTSELYSVKAATQKDIVIDGMVYNLLDNGTAELVKGYTGGDANKPTGNVTIPNTVTYNGLNYTVTKILSESFVSCEEIKQVTLPSQLQSIGDKAFRYCKEIESISFPGTLVSIGNYAFEGCAALKGIAFPDSLKTIGFYAFSNCSSLTSVKLPPLLTVLEVMSFNNCKSITSFELNEGLKTIKNNALQNLSSIKTIKIPASVTSITPTVFRFGPDAAFEGYEVSSGNNTYKAVDGVLYTANMKELCFYPSNKSSTVYKIPDSIEKIWDNAFYYISNLKEVQLTKATYQANNGKIFDMIIYLEKMVVDGVEMDLLTTKTVYLDAKTPYTMHLLDSSIAPITFNRAMVYQYEDESVDFVFCIEPEVGAGAFSIIIPSFDSEIINILGSNHQNITRYTPETVNLINLCAKFSNVKFEFENERLTHEQSIRYLTAQNIIYEIVCGNYTDAKKNDIIDKIQSNLGDEAVVVAKEIMGKIDAEVKKEIINKVPSFTALEKDEKPVYDFEYDNKTGKYTTTLTDTNNVLDKFKVVSSSLPKGVSAVIEGNKLIISSNNPVTVSNDIKLEAVDGKFADKELTILYHPSQQIRAISDIEEEALIVHFALKSKSSPKGNLSVSKKVTGTKGDTDKDFTFTVTLNDTSINTKVGDMTFKNGIAVFKLKHGDSKTASGLPAGTIYDVTESDNEGYKVIKSGETGTIKAGETASASFTNHKDKRSTGVDTPRTRDKNQLWVWSFMIVIVLGAMFNLRKQIKNN